MKQTDTKDLSKFDTKVMDLFNLSRDILNAHEKRNLKVSNRGNPFLSKLEKYSRVYARTDPIEHVPYFETIFQSNKRFILIGPQRDSWLLENNCCLHYGADCNVNSGVVVHLSSIYLTAVKLRDEITEENSGLPVAPLSETKYAKQFMYNLYCIFNELPCVQTGSEVQTKLKEHVSSLEEQLGKRSANGDFGDVFNQLSGMFEQFSGQKLDKSAMPKPDQLQSMVSGVSDLIDKPETKNMLGNLLQSFQGADNIKDVAGKLLQTLGSVSSGGGGSGGSTSTSTVQLESLETKQITGPSVNDEFD